MVGKELKASDSIFIYLSDQINLTSANEEDITGGERHEDAIEAAKVSTFMNSGCDCHQSCYKLFTRSHYELIRNQCAELEHDTLDMVIMGQVMALTTKRMTTLYSHQGHKVI